MTLIIVTILLDAGLSRLDGAAGVEFAVCAVLLAASAVRRCPDNLTRDALIGTGMAAAALGVVHVSTGQSPSAAALLLAVLTTALSRRAIAGVICAGVLMAALVMAGVLSPALVYGPGRHDLARLSVVHCAAVVAAVAITAAGWSIAQRSLRVELTAQHDREMRQQVLQKIAYVANDFDDIHEAAQHVLDALCDDSWPVGHLFVRDDQNGCAELVDSGVWSGRAQLHYPDFISGTHQLTARVPMPAHLSGPKVAAEFARSGFDLTGPNELLRSGIASSQGLRSCIVAPVLVGDQTVGMLELFSPLPLRDHGDDCEVLRLVGTVLGRVLERADARAAEQSRRQLQHQQRQALEINDNIVQGLVIAAFALDEDDRDGAQQAIDSTLAAARALITDLLRGPGDELSLDLLQRSGPAATEVLTEPVLTETALTETAQPAAVAGLPSRT